MDLNIINVPLKYGSGKDGVDLAFEKLLKAGLIDLFAKDNHNSFEITTIDILNVLETDKYKTDSKLKYLYLIEDANQKLAKVVYNSLKANKFPLIIGGDHSIAIGSIAGASKYYNKFAVVYIDAHGDFNTIKTSPSLNIHGMPLAAAMGLNEAPLGNLFYVGKKLNPNDLYHLGGRAFDKGEETIITKLNLHLETMENIKKIGLGRIVDQMIEKIKGQSYDGVHLSFDIDVLDANLVPGTGYPVVGGFDIEEVKLILSKLLKAGFITSIDFVEYNPLLDNKDEITLKNSLSLLKHIVDNL